MRRLLVGGLAALGIVLVSAVPSGAHLVCPPGTTNPAYCQWIDKFYGTDRRDVIDDLDDGHSIWARGGSDEVSGNGGDDRVFGGSGNDRLSGGRGNDALYGQSGRDRIDGNAGDDVVDGGRDNDMLDGGTGKDKLSGGSGNDIIGARDGTRDVIGCGSGRDSVFADRQDKVARDCETVRRR